MALRKLYVSVKKLNFEIPLHYELLRKNTNQLSSSVSSKILFYSNKFQRDKFKKIIQFLNFLNFILHEIGRFMLVIIQLYPYINVWVI
jgi:hypothetical protein